MSSGDVPATDGQILKECIQGANTRPLLESMTGSNRLVPMPIHTKFEVLLPIHLFLTNLASKHLTVLR
jgi:hypothetical protein